MKVPFGSGSLPALSLCSWPRSAAPVRLTGTGSLAFRVTAVNWNQRIPIRLAQGTTLGLSGQSRTTLALAAAIPLRLLRDVGSINVNRMLTRHA